MAKSVRQYNGEIAFGTLLTVSVVREVQWSSFVRCCVVRDTELILPIQLIRHRHLKPNTLQ